MMTGATLAANGFAYEWNGDSKNEIGVVVA
jgi:hypothetical protein